MKKIFSICMILLLCLIYTQLTYADEVLLTIGGLSQKIVDVLEVDADVSNIENPFTDISSGDEYYNAIMWMYQMGYIMGYEDGSVKPNNKITNAQLASILTRMVFGTFPNPSDEEISKELKNHWAGKAVWKATDSGLMQGIGYWNINADANENSINYDLFKKLMGANLSTDAFYAEYYYLENVDGSGYSLYEKEYFIANIGDSVSAVQKSYIGYTENTSLGMYSGIVKDNTLVLSKYYDRNIYEVNLIINADTSMTLKGKYGTTIELPIPTYNGNVFDGWYRDMLFENKVNTFEMPLNGTTLYANWTKQNIEDEFENYIINSITIKDMTENTLSTIPRGTFLATISLTNISSSEDAVIILARYTDAGVFKGLRYIQIEDVPAGSTIKLSTPVDNINGDVAKLKAFCWNSFNSLTPMGNSASFPNE